MVYFIGMNKKCIICKKEIYLGQYRIRDRERVKCCSRLCSNQYRKTGDYRNKIKEIWEKKFPLKIELPRIFQKPSHEYTVYIYVLIDPTTKEIKYVGKANNYHRRYISHLSDSVKESRKDKTKVSLWIADLRENNLKPEMKIIEVASESNWQIRERYWISEYRKMGSILNEHKGGTGLDYTPEMRKRKSETVKRLWNNPAYRKKVMDSRSKMYTPELRAKIGENTRLKWSNPELKEKHRLVMKKVMSDPDIRKRISKTLKNTLSTSNMQNKEI